MAVDIKTTDASSSFQIKPSVKLDELMNPQSWSQAYEFFERYPIAEVRKRCIEKMKDSGHFSPPWIEPAITQLVEAGDPIWEDLFAWHVSQGVGGAADTAGFSAKLWCAFPQSGSMISKHLANFFEKRPELYDKTGMMGALVRNQLRSITESPYYDVHWFPIERALKIVVLVKDYQAIDHIESFFNKVEDGTLEPYIPPTVPWRKDEHLAALKSAASLLRKARESASCQMGR